MSSMLRRRTRARSKKGCLTCKERHVRCDERTPYWLSLAVPYEIYQGPTPVQASNINFSRNCVRLGRECRFSANEVPTVEELDAIASLERGEILAAIGNIDLHGITHVAPHQQGLSSDALAIVQEAQTFARARPLPRCFWSTIQKDFLPNDIRYNLLAANHNCTKYALVAFSAYTHYRATQSQLAEEICIRHMTAALRELQNEIEIFGQDNADAIVTASVALAGVAENWNQWAVFVQGYAKTLSHIRARNFKTIYPHLLSDRFQLRLFASIEFNPASPTLGNEVKLKNRLDIIMDSINNTKLILGTARWREAGLEDLGKLAQVVVDSLPLDEVEQFHKLAWLRSWMFWVDLRQMKGLQEEQIMSGLFYALLLAILSLFPPQYTRSLLRVCLAKIQSVVELVFDDFVWTQQVFLLTRVVSEWNFEERLDVGPPQRVTDDSPEGSLYKVVDA